MEQVIWEGKASWLSAISVRDVVLTILTIGIWIIVPIIKILKLSDKIYKVTTERVIIKEGITSSSENEIEYYRIKKLSVSQSTIQKILNLGTIHIQSSDVHNPQIEMKNIPNAYWLREQMRGAVQNTRKNNNVRINENI